jgi:hypothetical protein
VRVNSFSLCIVYLIFSGSWSSNGDGAETKQCTLDVLNTYAGLVGHAVKVVDFLFGPLIYV